MFSVSEAKTVFDSSETFQTFSGSNHHLYDGSRSPKMSCCVNLLPRSDRMAFFTVQLILHTKIILSLIFACKSHRIEPKEVIL
jgi:hypothetical protein